MLRALQEQLAFPRIARERCRALKLRPGFVKAAELRQKVSAHARQEVIALEGGLEEQLINDLDPGLWTVSHGDRHCAVQINYGRGQKLG